MSSYGFQQPTISGVYNEEEKRENEKEKKTRGKEKEENKEIKGCRWEAERRETRRKRKSKEGGKKKSDQRRIKREAKRGKKINRGAKKKKQTDGLILRKCKKRLASTNSSIKGVHSGRKRRGSPISNGVILEKRTHERLLKKLGQLLELLVKVFRKKGKTHKKCVSEKKKKRKKKSILPTDASFYSGSPKESDKFSQMSQIDDFSWISNIWGSNSVGESHENAFTTNCVASQSRPWYDTTERNGLEDDEEVGVKLSL